MPLCSICRRKNTELEKKKNEQKKNITSIKRYGFDGEKKTTFADIGKALGVTRERARQLEAKAILKLRRTDYFKEVQCFFEE